VVDDRQICRSRSGPIVAMRDGDKSTSSVLAPTRIGVDLSSTIPERSKPDFFPAGSPPSIPHTYCCGTVNGVHSVAVRGTIIMNTHVTPDFKSRIKIYAGKLVDYSWDASLVITFLFGFMVLAMLMFALAINYKLISPPPLLCHYMVGGLHIEEFCK
jgi:hypothetical protein